MANTSFWNDYYSLPYNSSWKIYTTNSTVVSTNTNTDNVESGAEDGYRVFYNVFACPAKKKEQPKRHPVELF